MPEVEYLERTQQKTSLMKGFLKCIAIVVSGLLLIGMAMLHSEGGVLRMYICMYIHAYVPGVEVSVFSSPNAHH